MAAAGIYGAKEIGICADVGRRIEVRESCRIGSLPISISNTQLSISHDLKTNGAPTNYS